MGDKVYYWEMAARKPDSDEEDEVRFHEFEEGIEDKNAPMDETVTTLNDVIRDLERKILGEKIDFDEVHPKQKYVKKWIMKLLEGYPNKDDDSATYLLDAFRASLYSRSKERERLIVGLVLAKGLLLIIHSKKDPSIAEYKGEIFPAKLIIHPKNILRAAIIKKDGTKFVFEAYEYSRKWSKGHAEFWQIDPSYISWESLGDVVLVIKLDNFDYPIQLPLDPENIIDMAKNGYISKSGRIRLGRDEGWIKHVDVIRRKMSFIEFYDFYVTQREKLTRYRELFKRIINPHSLFAYGAEKRYKYIEDEGKIYEITPEGEKVLEKKEHSTYTICFFTTAYPVVKMKNEFIYKFVSSIFEDKPMSIWHAGEDSSDEPFKIGGLEVYNIIEVPRKVNELSKAILEFYRDSSSKKERSILQLILSEIWKENIRNKHFGALFEYMISDCIIPEINYHFKHSGLMTTEKLIDFKSADSKNILSPNKFVNKSLIPLIQRYTQGDEPQRLAILYGVGDHGKIQPIYNLKSDIITAIVDLANKELSNDPIKIKAFPIPFGNDGGVILMILIIPEGGDENRRDV